MNWLKIAKPGHLVRDIQVWGVAKSTVIQEKNFLQEIYFLKLISCRRSQAILINLVVQLPVADIKYLGRFCHIIPTLAQHLLNVAAFSLMPNRPQ